jgi:hypothetical protein
VIRQFKSDADVQEHFALQAELGATPDPPENLWEQIDKARRAARKMRAGKSYALNQPDLTLLVFPEIKSKQKTHPIKVVERLDSVPDVRPLGKKSYKLKGVI